MNNLKILIANKYLYPRGGDCLYTLRLMDLLRSQGHEVIPFTMKHPENIKTGYEKYFVDHIDFRDELGHFGLNSAVKVTSRAVVNKQAAALMERIIDDHRPDIVHLNNIHHQLTPSILRPAAERQIPIVWTLHDHILTCPDHVHLRNGSVCTKCAGGNYYHAIVHRCKKGSFGASLLAALENTYYKPEKLWDMVYKFICPSRFMADFLVDKGFPPGRVTNIPNFLPPTSAESTGQGYFLFFGRLSPEKGVDVLLKAMSTLRNGKLIIAGDGPERGRLENMVVSLNLNNVEFVGHQSTKSIGRLISGSLAVIVPSVWLENFPYSVMETMIASKPVVGSRIGGIPEMIEHGRTGLLFEPGDSSELARCMDSIISDPETAEKMGVAGREKAQRLYTPERHYEAVMNLYARAIGLYPSKKRFDINNVSSFDTDKSNKVDRESVQTGKEISKHRG